MNETLLGKLDRIESELKKIQSIKPTKQIDYSEGISILEGINKELSKKPGSHAGDIPERKRPRCDPERNRRVHRRYDGG